MEKTRERKPAEEDGNKARSAILASVRRHLSASAPYDDVRRETPAPHEVEARGCRRELDSRPASLAERFCLELEAVRGRCVVVQDENEAAEAVGRIIEQRKARRIAVSDSPLVHAVVGRLKSDAELLEAPSDQDLFECDMGITGAQGAVAETGTLVLESDQERHRLSSLVPPVHIAIIEAGRICGTLGEMLRSLSDKNSHGPSRTVTFITGPSRTSDIELTLAIGVHGPGEVFVILIQGRDRG